MKYEKSSGLIKKHSLLCKLLALKADDEGTDPEKAEETFEKIKKEVDMELVETTISEHIFNQGKIEGKIEGKSEGILEGELKGQITILENLCQHGILSEEQMKYMTAPLRQKLREVTEKQSRIEPVLI